MNEETKNKVADAASYVEQVFMNITGFVNIDHEWDGDNLIIFNTPDSEGSPADDNWEAARLIARLTGWETYEITGYDSYDRCSGEPFKIGLREKVGV